MKYKTQVVSDLDALEVMVSSMIRGMNDHNISVDDLFQKLKETHQRVNILQERMSLESEFDY
jgi:hypothetical protein